MASARNTSKTAPVGSIAWTTNERETFQSFESMELEDFTYLARSEMEWLNEHMADVFARGALSLDIAEVMKTPGKLRGKTPRTARRHLTEAREPLADIVSSNKGAKAPARNLFANVVPQPLEKQAGPTSPTRTSPPRSRPTQPSPTKDTQKIVPSSDPPVTGLSFADSGYFTTDNPNSQNDSQNARTRDSGIAHAPADANLEVEPRSSAAHSIHQSFQTADEEVLDELAAPLSPVSGEGVIPQPQEAHPLPASAEDHSLESQDGRASPAEFYQPDHMKQPPAESVQEVPLPTTERKSPVKPQEVLVLSSANYPTLPAIEKQGPTSQIKESQLDNIPRSPTGSFSDSAGSSSDSPESNRIVRHSNTNFAQLPPPKPLTNKANKKQSLVGAKITTEGHLEKVKQNGAARASWMNKKGNGKSLGGSIALANWADNDESANVGEKRKSSGGSSEPYKLAKASAAADKPQQVTETVKIPTKTGDDQDSQKSRAGRNSIQERIRSLRTTRSIPAPLPQSIAGLDYPDLTEKVAGSAGVKTPGASEGTETRPGLVSEVAGSGYRPSKVDNSASRNRAGATPKKGPLVERVAEEAGSSAQRPSPFRAYTALHVQPISPLASSPANQITSPSSPTKSLKSPPSSPLKPIKYAQISDVPQFAANARPSPKKTPNGGSGLLISSVKAHTSAVLQRAKDMIIKGAAVSASAKAEVLSPRLRNDQEPLSKSRSPTRNLEGSRAEALHSQQLYPDLGSAITTKEPRQEHNHPESPVSEPRRTRSSRSRDGQDSSPGLHGVAEIRTQPSSGRQTRSSKSRAEIAEQAVAELAARREREEKEKEMRIRAAERERLEREERMRLEQEKRIQLEQEERMRLEREEKVRQKEELMRKQEEEARRKRQLEREEKERERRRQEELARRQQEEIEKQQREEIRKREQEEAERRHQAELERQHQEEVRRLQKEEAARKQREKQRQLEGEQRAREQATEMHRSSQNDHDELEAPASSQGSERPPSRLQQKGIRVPKPAVRPQAKPKAQPIQIRTDSTREMAKQQQKTSGIPANTVKALKATFDAPQSSSQTLQPSGSQSSLRSVSSISGSVRSTKPPAALLAAEKQKQREQEQKERKLAQKKEIERKRAEEQERRRAELRKKQEEERRMLQQKGRTTPGPGPRPASAMKTLSRVNPVANLRQTSQEPEAATKKPEYQSNSALKGPVKRALPQDAEERPHQQKLVPPRPGAAGYHQEGMKKRRTGDYEEIEPGREQQAPERPGPIRSSSVLKKHAPTYVPTKAPAEPRTEREAHVSKTYAPAYTPGPSSAPPPQIGPSHAKGKQTTHMPSVTYSNASIPFASTGATPAPYKTPGTTKSAKMKARTPALAVDSPDYPDPSKIHLPDILTDSEDEDDDYNDSFVRPSWAHTPELRRLLESQQDKDPETVFGPIPNLDMDKIFKGIDERRAARFRMRTSSANWGGQDRLTQAEIQADLEARRKLHEQGKWTPGLVKDKY